MHIWSTLPHSYRLRKGDLLTTRNCKITYYTILLPSQIWLYSKVLIALYNKCFAIFVDENRTNSDDHLPYLMMAYRATVNESTKCTPNVVKLGKEITPPIDVIAGSSPMQHHEGCYSSYVEWARNSMEMPFSIVHEKLKSSFKRQKRYQIKTSSFFIRRHGMANVSAQCTTKTRLWMDWTICRPTEVVWYNIWNWKFIYWKNKCGSYWTPEKALGDGISENQYISNSDESIDIEPKNESDKNCDEEGDNDNALQASLHS